MTWHPRYSLSTRSPFPFRSLRLFVLRSPLLLTFRPLILLALPGLLFMFPACTVVQQQAYYVSPFNGNTGNYQTIPMQSDSIRSSIYASVSLLTGSANTRGNDHFNAFHGSLSASHNLGIIEAYYGADLTLGSYFLGKWDSSAPNLFSTGYSRPMDYSYLDQNAGNHFFGGTGFNGGINLVIPFYKREWRILGVETSLRHEFGRYLQFRKQLPDSAATLDIRDNFFGTAGLTSEFIGQTPTGQFGFKWAYGWLLGSAYQNLDIYDNTSGHFLGYQYFNFTFHYTYTRYTGYVELNTATKATGFHLGFNYRLTRNGR